MRFIKGKPIFSIDVHPSGDKLATGGQGGDSGRVVIWNWAPLVSPDAENDPNVPKILCLIDQHSGNIMYFYISIKYYNCNQYSFI